MHCGEGDAARFCIKWAQCVEVLSWAPVSASCVYAQFGNGVRLPDGFSVGSVIIFNVYLDVCD